MAKRLAAIASPLPLAPHVRRWPTVAAVFVGVALCGLWQAWRVAPPFVTLAVGLLVASWPRAAATVVAALDRVRRPSRKARVLIAATLFLVTAQYFLFTAQHAERDLYPKFHDEFMYLLQARMMAAGRLWLPQHPLADFFDSFLIAVRPVYAAVYFPGTALAHVPGNWLHLAPWWTSVVISASGATLLYVLVTDLVDGAAGLLAAMLAIASETWRTMAVPTLSHPMLVTLFLSTAVCLVRWSRRGGLGWAIAAGSLGAWAAITRPLDALVLILPMLVAASFEARKTMTLRRALLGLTVAACAAAPFLGLQLALDKGVTGHCLRTPVAAYDEANFPGMTIGGGGAALPAESPSPLPQVRDYYRGFLRPAFVESAQRGFTARFLVDRLPAILRAALPAWPALLLLPLGVLALRTPWRVALAAGVVTVPLAYALVPIYLTHYGLIAAPAALLLTVLGIETLGRCVKGPRAVAGVAVALVVLSFGMLPEIRGVADHFVQTPYLTDVNDKLADLEHTPAVVLFHYAGRTDVHEEPVFNIDAAWPDDARVIRAHDLGPRNLEIFSYYPRRYFYRYDRQTTVLTPLGFGSDLAATR